MDAIIFADHKEAVNVVVDTGSKTFTQYALENLCDKSSITNQLKKMNSVRRIKRSRKKKSNFVQRIKRSRKNKISKQRMRRSRKMKKNYAQRNKNKRRKNYASRIKSSKKNKNS